MATEEPLFLHLFENTLDWVCIVDKLGWFRQVNPAVLATLGYSWDELRSEPVSSRIHPEDRGLTSAVRSKLINNEPLINFQNRYVAKDGGVIWLQWTSVYMPEKELVFAIAKDITARKKMELETEGNLEKFKELTAHFKNLLETDRQDFATELHEELGQLATALKMDLDWIGSLPLQLDDASQKRLAHGRATAQTLINKIRKLSYSIDPSQIDEIGLDATLRTFCHEFILKTGIPCRYDSFFYEEKLSREIKLDLFRICQEALAKVLQQEQVSEVAIRIRQKGGRITLSVQDNGQAPAQEDKQSVVLGNMHRRAASINGELTVRIHKTKGTTVTVSIEI